MPKYRIRGVEVDFPCEAYPCQIRYMENVMDALQYNSNALLESPTGTGKTLSLLCATLAFRRANVIPEKQEATATDEVKLKNHDSGQQQRKGGSGSSKVHKPLRIIYTSRTHSQLKQVVKELKRTSYVSHSTTPASETPNHVRSIVLASRDHLCIHSVTKQTRGYALTAACQNLRKKQACHYYGGMRSFNKSVFKTPLDIEDLKDIAKDPQGVVPSPFCPFYAAHEHQEECEMILLPYVYLFHPSMRKALNLNVNDAIVIVDEAHNCESVSEDSTSFDIDTKQISGARREILALIGCGSFKEAGPVAKEVMMLHKALASLHDKLHSMDAEEVPQYETGGGAHSWHKILTENDCKSLLYDFHHFSDLRKTVDFAVELLNDPEQFSTANSKDGPKGNFLDLCCRAINMALSIEGEQDKSGYTMLVHEELVVRKLDSNDQGGRQSTEKKRVLSYWCFTPTVAIRELMSAGIRNLLVTSGTLAPLGALATSLGGPSGEVKFQVQLENTHTIDDSQILACIVPKGPAEQEKPFTFTWQNRDDTNQVISLGKSIAAVSRSTPGGVLCFFPSYASLYSTLERWQHHEVWSKLLETKDVLVEPSGGVTKSNQALYYPCTKKSETGATVPQIGRFNLEERMEKLNAAFRQSCAAAPSFITPGAPLTPTGALFLAVYRGKMSEGIDFRDNLCRAVCLCGLPYPATDLRVKLRRRHLDAASIGKSDALSGSAWYQAQAIRAVNQALGRVIRHQKDFGAIFLFDSRYANGNVRNALPIWVRNRLKSITDISQLMREVQEFFCKIPISLLDHAAVVEAEKKKDQRRYLECQGKSRHVVRLQYDMSRT